jgi:hypothetical protein
MISVCARLGLAGLLAIAPAMAMSGERLWQGAEYGMNVQQVLHAVPGSHPSTSPSTLYGGEVGLVEGEQMQIARQTFLPKFYFKNGRLTQVMLTATSVKSSSAAKAAFDDVVSALRVKYGHELSSTDKDQMHEAQFQNGNTNIGVILFTIGTPVLNVYYQQRTAEDAEKL